MTKAEIAAQVKTELSIADESRDLLISDITDLAVEFCNLGEDIPAGIEPWIRNKVKGVVDYETQYGTAVVFDVKSFTEGDSSISYNINDNNCKEAIYGLTEADKSRLRRYRRLRR